MSRIRVAVAGVSNRSVGWFIPSLLKSPDVEITAVCDVLLPKAEWAIKELQIAGARPFTSVRRMLNDAECDAVAVLTTDAHHAEVTVPALNAGKFVFCEKPLETTLRKCRAIIEADDRAGGRTFVGHNLRFAPVYGGIRKLIDDGDLGRLLTIQMDEFYDMGRTYFRRWNRKRSEGGGLWITKAAHDFDVMGWLAGAKPLTTHAMAARTYYVPKPGAAAQCRHCKLRPACPDRAKDQPSPQERLREECGGEPYDLCLYTADSDTFDHGMANVMFEGDIFGALTVNVVAGFTERRVRVSGTRGTVDGLLSGDTLVLTRRDPGAVVRIPLNTNTAGGHGGADVDIVADFLKFVRGAGEPRCRPRDAAQAVSIGLAATRSSDTGRAVKVDRFRV